jgi:hypothetical protein
MGVSSSVFVDFGGGAILQCYRGKWKGQAEPLTTSRDFGDTN